MIYLKKKKHTLFLSLMEPLPRTEILAPVSSWSLLIVLPWGPRSFPTKLTWRKHLVTIVAHLTTKTREGDCQYIEMKQAQEAHLQAVTFR